MKAKVKIESTDKRDLFTELSEGMAALAEPREGKRTLHTHMVEYKPAPKVTFKQHAVHSVLLSG